MTIKEVSEKYDISPDTLRYYERIGILPPVKRTSGGARNYDESDIAWIVTAKCMRSAGLGIKALIEYQRLLHEGDTESSLKARLKLLDGERDKLLERKAEIEKTLGILDYKIDHYEKAVDSGKLDWSK